MEIQEGYKTFMATAGKPFLMYGFTAEDGASFVAEACDLTQARRMRDQWLEFRENDRCVRCGQVKNNQVEERFSFGVYVGRLCVQCCAGYRDRCGLDQGQGDPRVLELDGETYWEE